MNCIDERNKIYSISLQELTYGMLRQLSCGEDIKIGSLLMFYEKENDIIYIVDGPRFPKVLSYINSALLMSEEEISDLLIHLNKSGAKQVYEIMLGVIKLRGQMEHQTTVMLKNPNNRFISLDDSIIQINKIISVKKYGDTAIDILTTGRNASVRKIYPTRIIRDFELRRIEKLLLEIA